MSYNDGEVHTDFYDYDAIDKESIAKQFSEGDIQLQNCLIKLWDKGIKTVACCRGHDEKQSAYISLMFDIRSEQLIDDICNYMYCQENTDEIELDFFFDNGNNTFAIYMKNELVKQKCLDFISNSINNVDNVNFNYKPQTKIPMIAEGLLSFAKRINLSCRYVVTKDEMVFDYHQSDTINLWTGNFLQLEDIIDNIKYDGNLPLWPISCDEKSVEDFLSFVNPQKNNDIDSGKKK